MSIQVVLNKINKLLLQIKNCLKTGNFELPLIKCSWKFDFDKKTLVRAEPLGITFKKNNISLTLRIVEILTIVRDLLTNNKYITKRNLYYQLVKYYAYYAILDQDLLIICDTLKVQRSALNIIVSSKLQIFWFPKPKSISYHLMTNNQKHLMTNNQKTVTIQLMYKKINQQTQKQPNYSQKSQPYLQNISSTFVNKQHLVLQPYQIFKIPNCPKLQVNITHPFNFHNQTQTINFLIMEKQSLFEILTESLNYKPPLNQQNWLLVNSKGYADMTAFRFVNEILKIGKLRKNIQFFYIGDYDAYGIDIMLNYAIGNQSFRGLWSQLKWLCEFDKLVEFQDSNVKYFCKEKFQKTEYRKQSLQDKKKMKGMLSRDFFQIQKLEELSELKSKEERMRDQDELFIQKVSRWRGVIEQLLEKDYQCEVESYFKNLLHPFDVIEIMIEHKFYI